jgi:LysM repeat protein
MQILLGLIIFLITFTPIARAQTISPTPSQTPTSKPTSQTLSEQINKLKERIATRVAELNLVEKRGIVGQVSEVKGTEITLITLNGKTIIVEVDELTKFTPLDKSNSFGISSIKKGMTLSAIGRYNKQTERLRALFIDQFILPVFLSGIVREINAQDFSLTIETTDKKTYTVDVETSTRTQSFTKDSGLTRSGFSRINPLDRILVTGYASKEDEKRISASRILILGDLRSLSSSPTPSKAK